MTNMETLEDDLQKQDNLLHASELPPSGSSFKQNLSKFTFYMSTFPPIIIAILVLILQLRSFYIIILIVFYFILLYWIIDSKFPYILQLTEKMKNSIFSLFFSKP